MTTAIETLSPAALLEREHMESARRFIAAIVAGDKVTRLLGEPHALAEAERLWDQFLERYVAVTSGPYARHGSDALRISLSSL